jgi:hypothetical protein
MPAMFLPVALESLGIISPVTFSVYDFQLHTGWDAWGIPGSETIYWLLKIVFVARVQLSGTASA